MVRPLTSSAGFTYLAVLLMMVVLMIMQGVAYQYMSTVMKREREEELLFRGQQIVEAIARWNNVGVPQQQNKPNRGQLNDLKDLLKDPKALQTTRFLRRDPTKEYNDPITGKEWEVIRDPSGQKGIVGVRSTSKERPLKEGGFVEARNLNPNDPLGLDQCLITMYRGLEGAPLPGITTIPIQGGPIPVEEAKGGKKYSDWQFVFAPDAAVPGQTTTPPIPGTSGS